MPKIIGQAEQQAAMRTIKAALKDLGFTTDFLHAHNPTGEYTVSFKGEDGHTYSTTIYAPDKQSVDNLATAYRGRIAADMMLLAEQNRIELDPDELAVFGIED